VATHDENAPLQLTREDLFELAWSKPISALAQDFGISDVALAKRCRRLGIPIPGRGYWARVDAGQTPHRPKLPKREDKWHDRDALTVAPSQHTPTQCMPSVPSADSSAEQVAVAERIASVKIESASSIVETLPEVMRTALREKHPSRSEFVFARGQRKGPTFPMSVSETALDRALLLADSLLRGASSLGWSFGESEALKKKAAEEEERSRYQYGRYAPPESPRPESLPGRLWVEGEEIEVLIEERMRDEPRTPTTAELAEEKRDWGYHAPRKLSVPTGNLRIVRIDPQHHYPNPQRQTWYDRKGRPVEEQIRDVLRALYDLAMLIKKAKGRGGTSRARTGRSGKIAS
jgi:hypothetical protein